MATLPELVQNLRNRLEALKGATTCSKNFDRNEGMIAELESVLGNLVEVARCQQTPAVRPEEELRSARSDVGFLLAASALGGEPQERNALTAIIYSTLGWVLRESDPKFDALLGSLRSELAAVRKAAGAKNN